MRAYLLAFIMFFGPPAFWSSQMPSVLPARYPCYFDFKDRAPKIQGMEEYLDGQKVLFERGEGGKEGGGYLCERGEGKGFPK